MKEVHNYGTCTIQASWLLGGMRDVASQVRPTQQAFPHLHAINTRNWARLTAAMLYLVAAGFFGVVMSVLATAWGLEGLNQWLVAENAMRPTVIYLLVVGGFSLATSFLLLSPLLLTRSVRILLLATAFMLMLAGFVVAVPAVVVSMVPSLFLLRFHQEVTHPASFTENIQHQDSVAASAI